MAQYVGHERENDDFRLFIKEGLRDTQYTPDVPILQLSTHQDVFIYGCMKKGFSHDATLGKSKIPLGVGWTKSDKFVMYRTTTLAENYPVILPTHASDLRAHIYGEVYRVPTDTILLLDNYESNGEYYKRVKLPVSIQVPGVNHSKIERYIWVYVGLRSYWGDHLHTCELVDKQTNFNNSYAYYSYKWSYEKGKADKMNA